MIFESREEIFQVLGMDSVIKSIGSALKHLNLTGLEFCRIYLLGDCKFKIVDTFTDSNNANKLYKIVVMIINYNDVELNVKFLTHDNKIITKFEQYEI